MRRLRNMMLQGCLLMTGLAGTEAQNPKEKDALGKSDPRAEKILAEMSKKYRGFNTIQTDFTYSIKTPDEAASETQSGVFHLKGNKYKASLGNQVIFCDGKTIWTYLKDANEVQVADVEADDNSIKPTDLFTIYEKGYLSALTDEKIDKGMALQLIDLTPIDKKKSYFKIRITIDKKKKEIISFRFFDKNGNRYTYEIKKFAGNLSLADTIFVFNASAFPGVQMIDLR